MFGSVRIAAVLTLISLISASAAAQTPLDAPEPLAPALTAPAPPVPQAPQSPASTRVFCEQDVGYHLTEATSVREPYRPFLGIFSDADWTPQLCAALIVENVQDDGIAVITYAFGPFGSGSGAPTPGGVLHGTGIVMDGELRFQNSDGSQFSFKPFYTDLQGQLTTPQGQTYKAIFKRTY